MPRIVVHTFRQADSEDPDLMVAEPLYDWEHSEQGKFVMENSLTEPTWTRHLDPSTYGWVVIIQAELEGPALTEYLLKWAK